MNIKYTVKNKIVSKDKIGNGVFSFQAKLLTQGLKDKLIASAYNTQALVIDKLLAQPLPVGGVEKVFALPKIVEKFPMPEEEKNNEPDLTRQQDKRARGGIVVWQHRMLNFQKDRVPFTLQPLLPKTLKAKIAQERDPRILISEGDYLRGIIVRLVEDSLHKFSVAVTVANREHPRTKIELAKLANILEYGTSAYTIDAYGSGTRVTIQIPPRPHWRPTILLLREKIHTLKQDFRINLLPLIIDSIK